MKKLIYTYLSALLVFISACSDFLEEENKGGINSEDFYSTSAGYQTLITASYSALRDIYGNAPNLDLAGTDIYMEGKEPGGLEPLYRYNSLYSDNEEVKTFYENCYKAIQKVNAGIFYNNVPTDMSDEDRTLYMAELGFLRAFYHFILMEQFGGVVINKEFTETPRINIPRSTLEESYTFVITEMEDALKDLPASSEPGRINKDVVNHYLAKVYLTRGWDLNSDADFTKAKEYADAVIASKGEITLPYATVWNPNNENNDEFIFSVQYSLNSIANTKTGGNSQYSLYSVYSGSGGGGIKRSSDSFVPAYHIHSNFQDNDNRYLFDFMWITHRNYFTYYTTEGGDLVFNYYPVIRDPSVTVPTAVDTAQWLAEIGGKDNLSEGFLFFPIWAANQEKYNENSWGATDRRLPAFKKFDCPENGEDCTLDYNASVQDIILARLAGTYFLKAEACIALGQITEARALVQKVIDRPGNKVDPDGDDITNSLDGVTDKTEALEAYLLEAGKEFLGEYNGRWPLLRRTKMLQYMLEKYNADLKRYSIEFNEKYNYRPIPEDAIILNEGLTGADQNPGY